MTVRYDSMPLKSSRLILLPKCKSDYNSLIPILTRIIYEGLRKRLPTMRPRGLHQVRDNRITLGVPSNASNDVHF